jgi:hypothetical protein
MITPLTKNHSDSGVDIHIVQLYEEAIVGIARPWIDPHGHLPSTEWLDVAADYGLLGVRTHQSAL